jgi:CRISPR/Cas system CSM-associated protein Csm2 small subunit
LYQQESYQQAYDLLTEARDLWQQTNVQPNPEIERLLRFVNAALNLENTRTLAETEPLYPVLSSYLNLARRDYNEAQEAVQGSGEAPAQQLLARAEENVDNVTAMRPYNWEARILKLRILRLRDSENFDEVFERRFEEAVERKDDDPQEALTAFETLAAINPDYPGLQNQIVELEIELGIRPDPVTQAQIAESNRLLTQARQIAAGAGEAQRQAAMSILEEAVTLNPENRDAQILLDRLRIQSGGQATVALSSAEEQQLRRAETLFIQDNAAQAYAIVQQLLRDEDNQRYPPLLDLEERIAARLGL